MFTILVPTDFTNVTLNAIKHAIYIAKQNNGKIVILHLAEDETHLTTAQLQLESLKDDIDPSKYSVEFEFIAKTGNIFNDIAKEASDIKAKLIIMGTHGKKGIQIIKGSYARKVILSTETPFLVIQDNTETKSEYKNIILPLDLNKDTKQTLEYAERLAKVYDSTIHICTFTSKDEFFQNKLNRNLTYSKDFMEQNHVNFKVHFTEGGSAKFYPNLVDYAKTINADLIMTLVQEDDFFDDVFGNSLVQNLITNKPAIPVATYRIKKVRTDEAVDGLFSLLG